MLVGVLDLLLIKMIFSKILRQPKTCVLYFSFIQQMIALKVACVVNLNLAFTD